MAKPSDILDPVFRTALEEAERLIDEGDYTRAARKCAETYLSLLDERPDLVPPPGGPGFGFGAGFGGGAALGGGAGPGAGGMRRGFWPGQSGIRLVVDAGGKPSLAYEKESFSFSEAATYLEFLLDLLVQLQREPA